MVDEQNHGKTELHGQRDSHPSSYWTNRSVVRLARETDPIDVVVRAARDIVLDAMEAGWSGPPFDPVQLADHLKIPVMPRDDIADARLVPFGSAGVCIEFNANRPPARTRFSVAHELAHTLFPDHRETVRKRGRSQGDDWQLELLCNIAASEFLMPVGTGKELENEPVDIDNLVRLRKRFDVSTEALLLRIVKLTREPCAVFAAARISAPGESPAFRLDYVVSSRSWHLSIPRGLKVSGSDALSDCTAVGFTSRKTEKWSPHLPEMVVECVGISAYPGDLFPRAVGVLRVADELQGPMAKLTEVRGDATAPRGQGDKVIAHVVNDRTPNWGAGFALALKRKWPSVQEEFIRWTREQRTNLTLGNTHVTRVSDELYVFQMVAQHGYGPSPRPRIRYAALAKCLSQCADLALKQEATVHMPRIGTGHAQGQWSIIRELIDEGLVSRGVEVMVYSPPEVEPPRDVQQVLNPQAAEG